MEFKQRIFGSGPPEILHHPSPPGSQIPPQGGKATTPLYYHKQGGSPLQGADVLAGHSVSTSFVVRGRSPMASAKLTARMAAADQQMAKGRVLSFYRECLRAARAKEDPKLSAQIVEESRRQLEFKADVETHQVDFLLRQGRKKLKLVASAAFRGITYT